MLVLYHLVAKGDDWVQVILQVIRFGCRMPFQKKTSTFNQKVRMSTFETKLRSLKCENTLCTYPLNKDSPFCCFLCKYF